MDCEYGSIDEGETRMQAMVRELREEIGYTQRKLSQLEKLLHLRDSQMKKFIILHRSRGTICKIK
ncbi:NUDIX domain-containing protein [Paenibacillus xylanexedens]|uniref:NUDIX domain-containing protein n=1 Tax=Paenibacillus xylanexedens TaxID=528191 RepID=UPI003CC81084